MSYVKIIHKGKGKASLHSDVFDNIREHFSVENDSFFGGRKKRFGITPREYVITPLGTFDACLTKEIIKFALGMGIPMDIEIDNKIKQILKPKLQFEKKIVLGFDTFDLRPYQIEAVDLAMQNGRGIILLPTATGKTLTMASLIKTVLDENPMPGKYVLILVPDVGLVSQTYKDLLKFGMDYKVSKWTGSDDFEPDSKIIVCNQAIIRSKSKSSITKHLSKNTGVLIIDEVQGIRKGNAVTKIVDNFDTQFRFGFTGTLPDGELDKWSVIGKVGPIFTEVEAHEMRSNEYIANVHAKIITIKHKDPPKFKVNKENPTEAYFKEIEWLGACDFRNKLICSIAHKLKFNSLLLVNRIEQGQALFDMANKLNTNGSKQIYFICGDIEVEAREKVKELMESSDDVICIAISAIFSTGISINNLHYIFFCAGGKSRVRVIQSIGRGCRLHPNKELMILFDIADNMKYSLKHLKQRMIIYEAERIKYENTTINQA